METQFDHEEIKRLIQQDLSQTEVARRVGCTRERVRQLELRYFGTNGRDRANERYCKELITPPDNEFTREAVKLGFDVESFITSNNRKLGRVVYVNGHLCSIYKNSPHVIGGLLYHVIRRTKAEAEFCVGVNPRGFLIMPMDAMPLTSTVISLRPRNQFRNGAYSKRHDYLKYLNDWDQLKESNHENLKAS